MTWYSEAVEEKSESKDKLRIHRLLNTTNPIKPDPHSSLLSASSP